MAISRWERGEFEPSADAYLQLGEMDGGSSHLVVLGTDGSQYGGCDAGSAESFLSSSTALTS
jgi:hypothetical protein